MTNHIDALLERVRGAGGPSRELDHDIAPLDGLVTGHCGGFGWQCADHTCKGCGKPMGLYIKGASYPHDWRDDERLPRYTASIDAALALVERLLPNASWGIRTTMEGSFAADVPFVKLRDTHPSPVLARTAPLAILAALLTALQSQDPK